MNVCNNDLKFALWCMQGHGDESDEAQDAEEQSPDQPKQENKQSPDQPKQVNKQSKKSKNRGARYLADLGTLYGYLQQAASNDEKAFVALHEAKTFFAKVLAEAPGFDPQALNKLYDRDEVSNTVMASASKFTMDKPWVVFFMALHLEDLKQFFASPEKDSCAVFSRFDFFHRSCIIPDLEDYNDYDGDEAIDFLADVLQLVEAQFPKLSKAEAKALKAEDAKFYSKRNELWKVPQDCHVDFRQHTT